MVVPGRKCVGITVYWPEIDCSVMVVLGRKCVGITVYSIETDYREIVLPGGGV
jgi:hypothetical protein